MSDRRKILIVSNKLTDGGAERFTSVLANSLDPDRFDVHVALLRNEITYPLVDSVTCHVLGQTSFLHSLRTVRRIRSLIQEKNPDVVLSTVNYVSQFVGSALKGLTDPPRWIARLGTSPNRHPKTILQKIGRRWQHHVYPRASLFVANSLGSADAFASNLPQFADRVTCIPNGVDINALNKLANEPCDLKANPDIPVLVSLGRLHSVKRYDWMLEAFRLVLNSRPAALWLIGDGPARKNIQQQIAKLYLADHVKLVGFQSNPYPFIKQASVYCMTSESESMPNAIIESQALGIPSVAMDCDFGPREVIQDGVNGYLVPVGDTALLSDKICQTLASPDRQRELGDRAKQGMTSQFTIQAVTSRWESVLESQ